MFEGDRFLGRSRQSSLAVRRRIGFVVSTIHDEYAAAVLVGARDAAAIRGADLLCFVGGELHSDARNEAQRTQLYEFVGPENTDALLVLTGAVGIQCGPQRMAEFLKRFDMPKCTVG